MTLHTLVLIILWAIFVLLAAGLLLLTFLFGRFSVKDNPNIGVIFVKTGLHVQKPIKAKRISSNNNGSNFQYGKKIVFVPMKYGENYYANKRMIFVNHTGQLIASPIANDVSLDEIEKEDLIYELVAGHIGADAMRALKGKSTINIILIAIIAFIIGVAVVIGFNAYQQSALAKQNRQIPPATQPAIIVPQTGEVK